ncbi:N-acetylmuramoyl-L-alanine amidase [Thermodesulfobacteriota bacterium]
MENANVTYTPSRNLIIFIGLLLCFCAKMTEATPLNPNAVSKIKTIVLDPGHGGRDTGVAGSNGTLEKTIALTFARKIAAECGQDFEIILTRTDDYGIDIPNRTAKANYLSADLFISIHAGGSFLRKTEGISLYYYKVQTDLPDTQFITTSKLSEETAITTWENIQNKHIPFSQILAKSIQNGIIDQNNSLKANIEGAPLTVLAGADMPAILIEIGHLSNPVEEKALRTPGVLSDISKGIVRGVQAFFKQQSKTSFRDLPQ